MLAIADYEWLKAAHVLASVMWVGGAAMLTLLGIMTVGLRDPIRAAQFARQAAFLGATYFTPLSLMVVGFAGGRIPSIQANRILLKDISIVGVHWGAYVREHPEHSAQAHQALEAMYKAGQIRPQIGRRYRLDEAPAGLKDLAQRKVIGKAVLVM